VVLLTLLGGSFLIQTADQATKACSAVEAARAGTCCPVDPPDPETLLEQLDEGRTSVFDSM
jgi:hypothetical protein